MALNVEDKIAALDPARRRKIEDRAAELIAEEMALRELHKARQLTKRVALALKRLKEWNPGKHLLRR